MSTKLLAEYVASITDLKRDPMGIVNAGNGEPLAILNRNKPAFYVVPPEFYEQMLELIDDLELAQLVYERRGEKTVAIDIDSLGNE